MSTLKVNAIEPYSGGTVTITGGTVTSASYATVAENLTDGDKSHSGVINQTFAAPGGSSQKDLFTVTGAVTEGTSFPNYTIGIQDYGGEDFGDAFTVEIFGDAFAFGTGHSISGKGVFSTVIPSGSGTQGKIRIEDVGAATKATVIADTVNITSTGGTTVNGALNVTGSQILAYDGVRAEDYLIVNNGNISQWRPDGVNAHIFQNENFFTDFYGTDLYWKSGSGESGLLMGELNNVTLTMNAFTPDFSTDNLFEVKSTLASGTTIGDWSGLWMTVPEAGTPVMKRGLTIEGLGDYADDAAAATGGVPVNGVYRTGSVLKIRVA